ncbi:uncharacterized protein LOC117315325 [Pecten maximus]|uniref:uncharacterized protein LOC117315325 n=1 Tax=Pecten maximus TaxID=6579 RepID=UPI001458D2AB|nr:uncharacterized protein LOC117315325 [Pecten maximus]
MPYYCCVPGCKSDGSGHTFPSDPNLKRLWRVAIRRVDEKTKGLWEPGKHSKVCSEHFLDSDYVQQTLLGERKRLKPNAVPSVFLFSSRNTASPSAKARSERQKRREDIVTPSDVVPTPSVGDSVIIESEPEIMINTQHVENDQCQSFSDMSVQCEIQGGRQGYSIENYRSCPKMLKYYTGFEDYDHFMLFFNILGPAAHDLQFKSSVLSPENQLFLTLMKLRRATENIELGHLFHISETTVSTLLNIWINFLYFQLKELDIWPSRDIVDEHMPENFSQFSNTRVILDATEIPIHKPRNVNAQSATFSSYKNKNTLKTMVGCTPKGAISYISDAYGGSASDRQIIERSRLLHDRSMFDSGDSIMADRGIMVQDLFASRDVKVNTPTMLKGKSQLDAEDVVRDRRIASKRIHVERI